MDRCKQAFFCPRSFQVQKIHLEPRKTPMITEMPKQQQLAVSISHSRISVGWSHEVNGFFVGLGLLEIGNGLVAETLDHRERTNEGTGLARRLHRQEDLTCLVKKRVKTTRLGACCVRSRRRLWEHDSMCCHSARTLLAADAMGMPAYERQHLKLTATTNSRLPSF